MDLIGELGEMAFASRLKRLSERLMKDVTRVYRELDMEFEARWFPLLYNLHLEPRLSITELAENLSLTHPAVNQLSAEMEKAGLILSSKDKKDERRRLLRLSAKGKRTVEKLQPVWDDIRTATAELLGGGRKDLFKSLEKIEDSLDQRDMYERVSRLMARREIDELEIIPYDDSLKSHFKELNRQWLKEYFEIEKTDNRVLNNPRREIIAGGGKIYFARLGRKIVGTAALKKHPNAALELTKMAVSPACRGLGVGTALLDKILDEAGRSGGDRLWLRTSPRLKEAVRLYQKNGFKKSGENPLGSEGYDRCTITMVRDL